MKSTASETLPLHENKWFVLGLIIILVIILRLLLVGTLLGQDDAFITYRFAEKNSTLHFFHWNDAEKPVYGTTTFLYTMLLTVIGFLGLPIPLMSIVLSSALQGGAAFVSYRLVSNMANAKAGFAAAMVMACDGFGIQSTIGMETYLYIFLITAGLWAYQENRLIWAAFFCALLVMTRIDGGLLSVFLAVHYLIIRRKFTWKPVAVYLATLLPWIIICLALFGSLLPNSFFAKQAHTMVRTSGLYSFYRFADFLGLWPFFILVVLALWGFLKHATELQKPIASMLCLFVVFNLILYIYGNLPDFPWYYAPTITGLWQLAAMGLFPAFTFRTMVEVPSRSKEKKKRAVIVKKFIVRQKRLPVIAEWSIVAVLAGICAWANWNCFRRDPFGRVTLASPHYQAAKQLQRIAKPNESVLASEVGVVGYYNPDLIVHDLLGLVSPQFIQPIKKLAFVEAAAKARPDYIFLSDKVGYKVTEGIFHPEIWYRRMKPILDIRDPEWQQKYGSFFADNYEIVGRWPTEKYPDGRDVYYILAKRKQDIGSAG